MSEQLLRNPHTAPTNEVIAESLGTANDAYTKFVDRLKKHEIDLGYRYYTDGKAWLGKGQHICTGSRGGQKEVTAFWISIWDGFFRITMYIPEKVRAGALALPLDHEIKSMIEEATQMGKLKFFPLVFDLATDERLDDIYTLIDFRKKIK